MSVMKLIMCHVKNDQKEAFSQGQLVWRQLNERSGFGGQAGGWDHPSDRAIIFGLWESEDDIRQFMQIAHDDLFGQSAHSSTFHSCSVCYFSFESSILPSRPMVPATGCIRISHCSGIVDKKRYFSDLKQVWTPAIAELPGICGGHVWRNISDDDHFMLLTFWSSPQDHDIYAKDVFPKLYTQTRSSEFIEQLSADTVVLEPQWNVRPDYESDLIRKVWCF